MNGIYLIKFLIIFLGLFAIIFLITLLTPKMAAAVDRIIAKIRKNSPERVDDDIYKVRSIYDAPTKNEKKDDNDKNINGDVENG